MYNTDAPADATQNSFNALNVVPKGIGSSVFDSFQQGFDTPTYGVNILASKLYDLPPDSSYATTLNALQYDKDQTPDSAVKSVGDWLGNAAGTALNPFVLPITVASIFTGGLAGEAVGGAISGALAEAAPELLGEGTAAAADAANASTIAGATGGRFGAANIASKAASITPEGIGESVGKSVGFMEGQNVLSDVSNSYNPDTNQISGQQFMSATKANLGYGVAFSVGELALGALFGKARNSEIDTGEPHPMTDNNAPVPDEQIFSPAENDFLQAHAAGASTEELTDKAHAVLNERGIPTDPIADTVNMSLLGPQDISNIAKTFPYETLSQLGLENVEHSIGDFITKNALDKATSNDALMDALRGHIERAGPDAADRPDIQIAKAITAYADEGKQASRSDVVDHLKKMLDEKALGQERVRYATAQVAKSGVDKIHAEANSMTPDEILKASQDIPKENRAFSDEITDHVRNYKKLTGDGAREIFDKFFNCVLGEK